jgi:hypothetical protein
MTQQATSLIDVLSPPGNPWLKELARRKANLPAGVRIVRFGEADDDPSDEGERSGGSRGSASPRR